MTSTPGNGSPARAAGFLEHDGPIAFAHRGGAELWPENTLHAFQGAIDLGIRYIETDLHTTRDGVIVCFHDPLLERTTDGRGLLCEKTLDELRRLDAGWCWTRDGRTFPFRGAGLTIPTFEEALALHPDVRFNVEIKQREPDMVGRLWRFIEERSLHDRVLVAAADDAVGDAFRRICGGRVRTSPGVAGVRRFFAAVHTRTHRLLGFDFDALQVPHCHPDHRWLRVVTRRFVEAAHHHGIQVHVWTIDRPEEMEALLDLGVDGIMSDRPDILVDVLAER